MPINYQVISLINFILQLFFNGEILLLSVLKHICLVNCNLSDGFPKFKQSPVSDRINIFQGTIRIHSQKVLDFIDILDNLIKEEKKTPESL